MTERKPNPDNALIDEMDEQGSAAQGSSAGGAVARDVGTRSEMHNTAGATGNERPHARDHPEALNETKGEKTIDRLDPAKRGPR